MTAKVADFSHELCVQPDFRAKSPLNGMENVLAVFPTNDGSPFFAVANGYCFLHTFISI
ncbi:MAG: hypothetical protein K8U57_21465 [Planctomycetes bacterium]|nr:hypothetical protein [Planctomycetota bacterium]